LSGAGELELRTGPMANGGSCVARHDGRVVFVRHALPGELTRVRITSRRDSFWHAEAVDILEASADRVDSLCPVAGAKGAGCCDLAFADPAAARLIKGEVVANQLQRLGGHVWGGAAEPIGTGAATGWRTRVRLGVDAEGNAGLHRYHSAELVTELNCGQVAAGLVEGLAGPRWRGAEEVHAVLDDEGRRHVVTTGRGASRVAEGRAESVQRVGSRSWKLPVTAFWQAHREAPAAYSALVAEWAAAAAGGLAWDLYGGAGVFAAALAGAVGENGRVLTVDTSPAASAAAAAALADLGQVTVIRDSVRRMLSRQPQRADVAVLDPPRAGAGRAVVDSLAAAEVPRIIHIGCEAAAFARDVGLYRARGYQVTEIRVFDAFPLTHHVECMALLTR